MAQSRPRPQSQAPPIIGPSCQSVPGAGSQQNLLQSSGNGINTHELTNYSLLFQQQTKQSEEVYALKFQLRQVESELDKQRALHQQNDMQLKNRITDILEQKEKAQQINDMLINSLRSAVQNQFNSKAYLLEFDYVCDMVRTYTNQANRRKSSFLQQNAAAGGNETSLESIQVEAIECRTVGSQTTGEPWTQANLTFTPKEQDLLDKIQQLEKVAQESRNAKDKSNTQKNEFACKVKELAAQTEEQKLQLTESEKLKSELQNQVEAMKNEVLVRGNKDEQLASKESEIKHLYDSLQAKYQKKKKSAKDKKHAYKAEIASLKRQLADTLQKAFNFSEENTQLKRFQSEIDQLKNKPMGVGTAAIYIQEPSSSRSHPQTIQAPLTDREYQNNELIRKQESAGSGATENVRLSTAEEFLRNKPNAAEEIPPSQMNHTASQFLRAPPATTSYFESNSHLQNDQMNFNDPSNLVSTGELTAREQANPTRQVKQRRLSKEAYASAGGRYKNDNDSDNNNNAGQFKIDMKKKRVLDITPVGAAGGETAKALQEYFDQKKQIKEEDREQEHSSSFMLQLHSPQRQSQPGSGRKDYSMSSSLVIPKNPKVQPTGIPAVSSLKLNKAFMSERSGAQTTRQEPLTERAINTEQTIMPNLKSHAKLFSKFVNTTSNRDNTKNKNTVVEAQEPAPMKNSHSNTGQAPTTTNLNDVSQQSLCLMGSIVQHTNIKDTSQTKLEISRTIDYTHSNHYDKNTYNSKQPHEYKQQEGRGLPDEKQHQKNNNSAMLAILEDDASNNEQQQQNFRESADGVRTTIDSDQYKYKRQVHRHHSKQLTGETAHFVIQPQNILVEESADQLVKIEASPERSQEAKYKSKRGKKQSGEIKISPIKAARSDDSPQQPNKHRSPCCAPNQSNHDHHATAAPQMLLNHLSLAPVAQIDISKPQQHLLTKHKKSGSTGSGALTSGQRYLRQHQKQKQQQQSSHHPDQQDNKDKASQLHMLVEEQLSESRSCSIEHHNMSSSSIEGMIKFGMSQQLQASQHSHRRRTADQQAARSHREHNHHNHGHRENNHRQNHAQQHAKNAASKAAGSGAVARDYRSPQLSHNYNNPLNRSRSPNGIEREQIGSIIDEITDQLKAAEILNQNRRSSLGYLTSGSDGEPAVVEVSPRTNAMLLIDGDGRGGHQERDAAAGETQQHNGAMFCQTQRTYDKKGPGDDTMFSSSHHNHWRNIDPRTGQNNDGPMTQRDHHTHHHAHQNFINHQEHMADKHSTQSSNRRKFLTRDALIDAQSCRTHTTNGGPGNCTHYHNHYEAGHRGGGRGYNQRDAGDDPVVSERLIKQCFDKIGQSLDQLAAKDRMIQKLISDNYASDKKKSGLRKKLKQLRQTLQDCQSSNRQSMNNNNLTTSQEHQLLLYEANTNLSFENEHLKDKVEKTQNLLKMYQLDSPLKATEQMMNRSNSQYDLEKLRQMAGMSFPTRKSPQQCKKQRRQTQQSFPATTSLRLPLTDRFQQAEAAIKYQHQQMSRNTGVNQNNQTQLLAQKRQELFRSMVNAASKQSSGKLSEREKSPVQLRSAGTQKEQLASQTLCKQSRSKEARNNAVLLGDSNKGHHNNQLGNLKFSATQKLGGFLTARNGQTVTDENDTRCESNDALSNANRNRLAQNNHFRNQFSSTIAMQSALKTNNLAASMKNLQFSQEFMHGRQKHARPDRCRDGFLKASNQHLAANWQQKQGACDQKKPELIKSSRSRYEEVEEDNDDEYSYNERTSMPTCIEEFSLSEGPPAFEQSKNHQFARKCANEDEDTLELQPQCALQAETTTLEDIGDYDLPSRVIAAGRSNQQIEMNQNNLSQMHGRQLVVQSFNKVLVIQNQRQNTQEPIMQQSYQSENDESRVVYDYVNNAAAQFRGVQHPQKQVTREQSPTIGEDSDATQPDDFFQSFATKNDDIKQKIASPRNYYYHNN